MDPCCYFLGDIGLLNEELNQLVKHITRNFQLGDKVILLGDNFYERGVESTEDELWEKYKDIFEPIKFQNIYAVLGNHDYVGNPYAQLTSKYMMNKDFYYKYRFSSKTDFFFIDTMQLYPKHCGIDEREMIRVHNQYSATLMEKHIDWLIKSLRESKAMHKIVVGHYPIITNGYYSSYMKPLYRILMPIFEQYNVKAYISGHEHNAQFLRKVRNGYLFHQIILGCSSEHRMDEYVKPNHCDMLDDSNNYFLCMNERGDKLIFDYVNKEGRVKHCYII